jgi:hypothetical protein
VLTLSIAYLTTDKTMFTYHTVIIIEAPFEPVITQILG